MSHRIYNGSNLVLTTNLRVTGDTTAAYDNAAATVTNVGSAASPTGTGDWRVVNPAGGLQITRLVLIAVPNSVVPAGDPNSDYSFVSLSIAPEPSTLPQALGALALGVVGM